MARSLMEQWLPAATIGAESVRERGAASALPPLNYLHVWWARRPLTASRAAILAALLPAWPTRSEAATDPAAARVLAALRAEFAGEDAYRAWFLRALGILGEPVAARAAIAEAVAAGRRTSGNAYGYDRAFTVTPDQATVDRVHRLAALRSGDDAGAVGAGGRVISVLDPFGGGGSIPLEAARYGFHAIANELNPVATAVLEGTVALPPRLGPDFADVLRERGRAWCERVRDRLARYFPIEHPDDRPAYVWAHTVPCPGTGRPTPLAPDFRLSRDVAVALDTGADGSAGVPAAAAATAVADGPGSGPAAAGGCAVRLVEGADAARCGARCTYRRGVGRSIWTGETFRGGYIRRMAAEGRVGAMLLGVSVTRAGTQGRRFRAPTAEDLAAVDAAGVELARLRPAWEAEDLIPDEPVPSGAKTDEALRMGLRRWSDMFTPRQLLSNVTALEELRHVVRQARSELGDERGRAVALYLAMALDKAVNFNGMLSSWIASQAKIRSVFDRHNFAYKWSFAELDGAHSLLPWAVGQVVDAYRGVAELTPGSGGRGRAVVVRGSATALPLADGSVDAVVTDPPYFDNVMYAECSDYFYVWLKRSLRDTWPQFTDLVLTDKQQEAVVNTGLFQGKGATAAANLAEARYADLLTRAFREAYRVLRPDGTLTVMFTHRRVDAWDTLATALLEAGFAVTASWPVRTEFEHSLHQARQDATRSTIFLACRRRSSRSSRSSRSPVREPGRPVYWADVRADVERAADEAVRHHAGQGMTGVDLTITAYGPVLAVLSDHWPVYADADGPADPVLLRPAVALDLARRRVADAGTVTGRG